ncbi:MAG: nicotinate-nucleotide adenylyltransferase [bacterium]
MNRIGIFGGTFNPIHNGHLIVAEEVKERFGLNKICFVPAYLPPHKSAQSLIPASDRLRMVEMAVADNPGFGCSRVEIERKGLSFSIDTVRYFREKEKGEISFILGADAFVEIESWQETEKLFSLCRFIVLTRPGTKPEEQEERIRLLKEKYRFDFCHLTNGDNQKIDRYQVVLVNCLLLDISSSYIRKKSARRGSIKYLVPHKVEKYIRENRLYINGQS